MKTAFIRQTGPPENIVYGDLPVPEPAAGGVLVRVGAVAVNPINTYIRSGAVAMPLAFPSSSAAIWPARWKKSVRGKAVSTGRSGVGLKRRDARTARDISEYAAVDESWLYPLPAGVSEEAAAACAWSASPLTWAWFATPGCSVERRCSSTVDRAESVRRWCRWPRPSARRAVTTAGSEEGLALCRQLGADLAIDYEREDVARRVNEFAPQGVNVWWETVREPNFDLAVSLLAERGRMVLMAGHNAGRSFRSVRSMSKVARCTDS